MGWVLLRYGQQEGKVLIKFNYHIPDFIKIDGDVIEKADFTELTVNHVLDKLHTGTYDRMEVTFQYPEGQESLVYLCEDGKAIAKYFSDAKKYIGSFFENRNGASYIPMNKLPYTTIHNQNVLEQEVVFDRSILGAVFLELLNEGKLEQFESREWYKEGHFSGRNFSNKNAYLKQRIAKGEFE